MVATVVLQFIHSNCVTTAQAKELARVFNFEKDRLTFLKEAYAKTFDQNRYYLVNDVFDFDHAVQELDEYIRAQNKN